VGEPERVAASVKCRTVEGIDDLHPLARQEREYSDLASVNSIFCSTRKPCSRAAQVGAKVGANVHSHQAMPGDVQPLSAQMNATLGDVRLRQATGWS
jgi:hypothetical protein